MARSRLVRSPPVRSTPRHGWCRSTQPRPSTRMGGSCHSQVRSKRQRNLLPDASWSLKTRETRPSLKVLSIRHAFAPSHSRSSALAQKSGMRQKWRSSAVPQQAPTIGFSFPSRDFPVRRQISAPAPTRRRWPISTADRSRLPTQKTVETWSCPPCPLRTTRFAPSRRRICARRSWMPRRGVCV